MDIAKTLTNPYVLIGGAALGLVLIISGKGNTPAGSNAGIYNSVTDAYNKAALQSQDNQLAAWVEVTKARIAAATDYGKTLIDDQTRLDIARVGGDVARYQASNDFLKNITDNSTQLAKQRVISNAGVTNAVIQHNTAVTLDAGQNMTRMALANTQAAVDTYATNQNNITARLVSAHDVTKTRITTNGQIDIAKTQAKAVKTASKYNMFSSMFGSATSVLKAVL